MRFAVYDMAGQPATFDVCPFVATVGAQAAGEPVHFVVLADQFRDRAEKDRALSLSQKKDRARNIIVPACRLLPGATVEMVTDRAAAETWRRRNDALKPSTFIANVHRECLKGRDVRRFRTSTPSPHPGAVVITLRQSPIVPAKNCDMGEWLGAASLLMAEGHEVVLVPDTAQADRDLPGGFRWCREAAIDLDLRAALYQRAACSLSMGLGPMAIAMFMPSTRYVVFVNHRDDANRQMFERVWGVKWGQQAPFAGPGQVIAYEPADEDAIVAVFRDIQASAAA